MRGRHDRGLFAALPRGLRGSAFFCAWSAGLIQRDSHECHFVMSSGAVQGRWRCWRWPRRAVVGVLRGCVRGRKRYGVGIVRLTRVLTFSVGGVFIFCLRALAVSPGGLDCASTGYRDSAVYHRFSLDCVHGDLSVIRY